MSKKATLEAKPTKESTLLASRRTVVLVSSPKKERKSLRQANRKAKIVNPDAANPIKDP